MDRVALLKTIYFRNEIHFGKNLPIFSVINNNIKQLAFEKAYESTLFFYNLFYVPTFLPNLRLMHPCSLQKSCTADVR